MWYFAIVLKFRPYKSDRRTEQKGTTTEKKPTRVIMNVYSHSGVVYCFRSASNAHIKTYPGKFLFHRMCLKFIIFGRVDAIYGQFRTLWWVFLVVIRSYYNFKWKILHTEYIRFIKIEVNGDVLRLLYHL